RSGNVSSDDPQQFRIDGLDPDKVYSFVFGGSYKYGTDYVSAYRIGDQVVTLLSSQNTTKTVSIDNVKPGNDGSVTVSLYANPGSSSGVLNGMIIRRMSHAVAIPVGLKATFNAPAVSLSWEDKSEGKAGFNVYRSDGDTGHYSKLAELPPNSTSYSDDKLLNPN